MFPKPNMIEWIYLMFIWCFVFHKKLKALPIHGHSSSSILMSLHKSGTFRSLRGPAKRMVKLNLENVIPQHWLQFYGILNVIWNIFIFLSHGEEEESRTSPSTTPWLCSHGNNYVYIFFKCVLIFSRQWRCLHYKTIALSMVNKVRSRPFPESFSNVTGISGVFWLRLYIFSINRWSNYRELITF